MGNITLFKNSADAYTRIPNIFIDEYMTQAEGEYVKIFLYLLRHLDQPDFEFSISNAADHFDHTEKDINRALRYWEKVGLLHLDYDSEGTLTAICIHDELIAPATRPQTPPVSVTSALLHPATPESKPVMVPLPKTYSPQELANICEEGEAEEIIFFAEQYLGRPLNHTDLNIIFSWYDQLQFPADLVEYIIESCVSRGHISLHYMQRIAQDLAGKGIRTVAQAKEQFAASSKVYQTVVRSFGIRGRNLVPAEQNYIRKWTITLGFSDELIGRACEKTI